MKTLSLLTVLAISICLIGCENTELINCQQEKDLLQSQLDQTNATIAQKDSQIEALKAENTEVQKKAMEAVSTMMTKQAAKDKELKNNLDAKCQQVKELETKVAALEKQIANHKCPVPETTEEAAIE